MLINVGKITRATRILATEFRAYRLKFAIMIILGLVSGFAESFGIAVVIPLFYLMTGNQSAGGGFDTISHFVENIFSFLHVPLVAPILLALILILFFTKAFIYLIAQYFRARIVSRFEENTRKELFNFTMTASWPYFLDQKIGQLENILTYDVERAASALTLISAAILTTTNFIMYASVSFSISAKITLIVVTIGGLLILAFKPIIYRIRKLAQEVVATQKEVSHHVSESISGTKMIKSTAAEQIIMSNSSRLFANLRKVRLQTAWLRQSTLNFIEPLGFVVIAMLFIFSYRSPSFNIAAFAVVMYLVERMFGFLQTVQTHLHNISEAVPYVQTIVTYRQSVAKHQEDNRGTKSFLFGHELRLNAVSFAYHEQRPILRALSLSIPRGALIGIIGISGAGKTTIADLFLRLLKPTSGTITVDGNSIEDIQLANWRRNIGYVPQDTFLINDTIRKNISFYNETITDSDIIEATKAAHIYDVIQSLPDQFETVVGERGVKLSGGQRQRIALARVLARKPQILILDEATSAIDAESERLIRETLVKLRGKTTVIIITHQLTTVENLDRIVVLSDGVILEDGTPEELIAKPGSYLSRLLAIR
jgi:ABC-type multidrug transport system fused ATPase/permease subunit